MCTKVKRERKIDEVDPLRDLFKFITIYVCVCVVEKNECVWNFDTVFYHLV